MDLHTIRISDIGFRRGHFASSAILELLHKITQAIERKEYTLTLFIDLSKAFDIIDHSIFYFINYIIMGLEALL